MRRDCIDILSEERIPIKNRKYKNKKVKYNPQSINRNIEKKIRVKVKNLEQLKVF